MEASHVVLALGLLVLIVYGWWVVSKKPPSPVDAMRASLDASKREVVRFTQEKRYAEGMLRYHTANITDMSRLLEEAKEPMVVGRGQTPPKRPSVTIMGAAQL